MFHTLLNQFSKACTMSSLHLYSANLSMHEVACVEVLGHFVPTVDQTAGGHIKPVALPDWLPLADWVTMYSHYEIIWTRGGIPRTSSRALVDYIMWRSPAEMNAIHGLLRIGTFRSTARKLLRDTVEDHLNRVASQTGTGLTDGEWRALVTEWDHKDVLKRVQSARSIFLPTNKK